MYHIIRLQMMLYAPNGKWLSLKRSPNSLVPNHTLIVGTPKGSHQTFNTLALIN